jgi:hypothetical protein
MSARLVPFSRFAMPLAPAAAVVRRSVEEARAFLADLTRGLAAGGPALTLDVTAGQGSGEGFRLSVSATHEGVRAEVVGTGPVGAARGVSRLLGMIEIVDGRPAMPVLPAAPHSTEEPLVRLRGLHFNGWAANHPYSFRGWSEQDWCRAIDLYFHEGVNLLFLWPSIEIMPVPLSRADEAQLEEVHRVVEYAQKERGMQVWLMHSANRVAISDTGIPDPRHRPYWLPEAQVDLDPGRPDHLARILASREALYRVVDNLDGVAMIDSDPGGWNGSPVSAYVELCRQTRALLDRVTQAGARSTLVSWLWQGWGFTSWDPDARGPVITETVRLLRAHLAEPWMLITGAGQYLPTLQREGVLGRTVFMPYGAIEAEPSLPFTNIDPASIDGAADGAAAWPGLAGVMGNVQCPVLQLPAVHHFMQRLARDRVAAAEAGGPAAGDRADLRGLGRLLFPAHGDELSRIFAALNATTVDEVDAAARLLDTVRGAAPLPGLIGRLLFPRPAQVLDDLADQLAVRRSEAALGAALDAGAAIPELSPLVSRYFRACLAWEEKHGYFGVMKIGRLASLFPRPPIPRESIRTWPPFVPWATGLRRALTAAGDADGERFFAPLIAELGREFDPAKARQGCGEAMQVMMRRPEAVGNAR